MSKKISEKNLLTLIKGLKIYKHNGVIDPWILNNGEIIDPLDVLEELKELRKKMKKLK